LDILVPPHVEERDEIPYCGIRVVTPFRGMLSARDQLIAELRPFVEEFGANNARYFLRLHTIDMKGEMDLEVGAITDADIPQTDRIKAAVLPAGRYASMMFVNHAIRGNRHLLEWIADQGLVMDKAEIETGDHFGCRYELFPAEMFEIRKRTTWPIEINIRLH
jgi:effector-binding domain-containing protein